MNWLDRIFEGAAKQVQEWPEWMKRSEVRKIKNKGDGMSRIESFECDKCGQKQTREQESEGAIGIGVGQTIGSLCLNCRKTTTVFDAQELGLKLVKDQNEGKRRGSD